MASDITPIHTGQLPHEKLLLPPLQFAAEVIPIVGGPYQVDGETSPDNKMGVGEWQLAMATPIARGTTLCLKFRQIVILLTKDQ